MVEHLLQQIYVDHPLHTQVVEEVAQVIQDKMVVLLALVVPVVEEQVDQDRLKVMEQTELLILAVEAVEQVEHLQLRIVEAVDLV